MKPTKPYWLDRRIAAPGPHLALALNQAEFDRLLRHLKLKSDMPWVRGNADAATHVFTNQQGLACIIGLRGWLGRDPIEVAGLLVHEAVHVWQAYAEGIGETNPGNEQEAYGIQAISQELMAEFARRMESLQTP